VAASAQTTTADKSAVESIVREYILANPEIIAEALQLLQAKKKSAEAAADRQMLTSDRAQLVSDPTSPVGGNARGGVTVVGFFDYLCGVCKRIHPIVNHLVTVRSAFPPRL